MPIARAAVESGLCGMFPNTHCILFDMLMIRGNTGGQQRLINRQLLFLTLCSKVLGLITSCATLRCKTARWCNPQLATKWFGRAPSTRR